MNLDIRNKPLGRKAYGSIGHLPMSRLGPADRSVTPGQARIATERARDRHDRIIVQEKLDGSCCAVALMDGTLHALGRAGWPAQSSKFEQHQLFTAWVRANAEKFFAVLRDGERVVGEWLAQAHGTRYALRHEPFVAFDIMIGDTRLPYDEFAARTSAVLVIPHLLSDGGPIAVETALAALDPTVHGAIDPIEGVMYRVERRGAVDYLAKFVRADKADGIYLPEISGRGAVWNWRP